MDPNSLWEHRAFVRTVVARLLDNADDVDDVVSETWLRALRSPPHRRGALRAWLARVSRNLAFTLRRSRRRSHRRERRVARPEGVDDSAEHLEQHRLVVEAVLTLEEPFRSAILMRYYEDLPPREIAARLDVPVATVRSRVRRGTERMRSWFDARSGGSRAVWTAALLPLLGVGAKAAPVAAVAAGGAMAMKAKLVFSAIVVVLAAMGVVVWQATSTPRDAAERRAESRVDAPVELPHERDPAARAPDGAGPGDAAWGSSTVVVLGGEAGGSAAAMGGSAPKVEVGRAPKHYRFAGPTDDPDRGGLRVIVVGDAGEPRPEAKVTCFTGERNARKRFELDSDTAGLAEFSSLPPGSCSVNVKLGPRHRNTRVALEAGRLTELTVVLARGATVAGRVLHIERGPLPKLTLEVDSRDGAFRDSFHASTDSEGCYRFEDIPPGTHLVTIQGGFIGYATRPRGFLVIRGPGDVTRDFVLGRVTLRGVVRDALTGGPVPGVRVALRGKWYCTATTDALGAYRFLDLPPGDHKLVVMRDGYGVLFTKTGPIPEEGTLTTDFTLEPAAVLVVSLRDEEDRPVPGRHSIGINELGGDRNVGSQLDVDAEGIGRYPRIVPGKYSIRIRAQGFVPHSEEMEIEAGENRLEVTLHAAAETAPVALRGTVRDAVTKQPIPGVIVSTQKPRHQTATTDKEGVYELRDLPPGGREMVFSRDGYGVRFVRGAEGEKFDCELHPAATLHIHVTDSAGRPVPGEIFLGLNGTTENATRIGTGVKADENGHAVYRRVVPGSYRLRFSQGGVGEADVHCEIVLGENTVHVRLE